MHQPYASQLARCLVAAAICTIARPADAQQRPPAPVRTAAAVAREVASGQMFVATVRPLRRAVVGSAVDGRVVELLAEQGDRVEKSQPLAQLLTNTIELELEAAEATLELRKHQLAELENGSRPGEIAQAKAKMLAAEATMQYRAARRRRLEDLRRSSRAITEDEIDAAIAEAAASEQNYYDLQSAYELAVEGPRAEQIAQATSQVAMQAAEVERIKDRINKYTIRSRFAGYVVKEYVEAGAWVQTGDPALEVVALDEVEVEAYVTESHVPSVRVGSVVRVELPALPDRIFTGEVTAIVPQADPQARTFPVQIRVENEIDDAGPVIKAGMVARVYLPTGSRREAVLVPKDALVLGGSQPVVYVVVDAGNEQIVEPQPVRLGVAEGELIQVVGELEAGTPVVVEGNERLRPGQAVRVLAD